MCSRKYVAKKKKICGKMENVSRELDSIKQNQKSTLELKNIITKIKQIRNRRREDE